MINNYMVYFISIEKTSFWEINLAMFVLQIYKLKIENKQCGNLIYYFAK